MAGFPVHACARTSCSFSIVRRFTHCYRRARVVDEVMVDSTNQKLDLKEEEADSLMTDTEVRPLRWWRRRPPSPTDNKRR